MHKTLLESNAIDAINSVNTTESADYCNISWGGRPLGSEAPGSRPASRPLARGLRSARGVASSRWLDRVIPQIIRWLDSFDAPVPAGRCAGDGAPHGRTLCGEKAASSYSGRRALSAPPSGCAVPSAPSGCRARSLLWLFDRSVAGSLDSSTIS